MRMGPQLAWDVLADVDRACPAAVDLVLAHPYIRAWATRCLRERHGASMSMAADTSHLASIAITAAIRAEAGARLTVPIRDGYVDLPTLGRLPVMFGHSATVTTGKGWFQVRTPNREYTVDIQSPGQGSGWQPVRTLHAGEIALCLEDTDPYRDCYGANPAERLGNDDVSLWQASFAKAWDMITRDYPAYASGIAAGLTTITPLVRDPREAAVSATTREAFGAIAVAMPDSPDILALLLLHEFQHVKLGALLDLFDLFDHSDQRLFESPWRDDPRPLEALLQGTYAHIAVADFWRVRPGSQERLARSWEQAVAGVQTLTASGSLTPLGIRFTDGMLASLGGLR